MSYIDKEKQAAYQRKWIGKRRAEWLKVNGPCKYCGSWRGLEVDHIHPGEKVSHNVWSWTKDKRDRELAKCQVLCHRCHAKKTAKMRPKPKHGTQSAYTKLRCRCDKCREGHRLSVAAWREKIRETR